MDVSLFSGLETHSQFRIGGIGPCGIVSGLVQNAIPTENRLTLAKNSFLVKE